MPKFLKALGSILVAAFAMAALTAFGGSNNYHLLVVPGTDANNKLVAGQVVAYISNLSTANIGSLVLAVDRSASGLQIDPAHVTLQRLDGVNPATWKPSSKGVTATVASAQDPQHPNLSEIAIGVIQVPIKNNETLKITMNGLGCGAGSTWSAPHVYNSQNFSGGQFTRDSSTVLATDVPCGLAACSNTFTVVRADNTTDSKTVNVERGLHDADGTCTSDQAGGTPFFLTNRLGFSEKTVTLSWNNITDEVFTFDANVGTTDPKLSWKNFTGSQKPAFLSVFDNAALTCSPANSMGDFFPRRFGVLGAAVSPGATSITVSATSQEVTPPASSSWPFNIFIGHEMLTVDSIDGNVWTLDEATPAAAVHAIGDFVMYTPLNFLTETFEESGTVQCLLPSPNPNPAVFNQANCPYNVGDVAKWCRVPGTGFATPGESTVPWKNIGSGDPIWSGGDL